MDSGGVRMFELETYAEKGKSLGLSRAEIIDTKNVVVGNWVWRHVALMFIRRLETAALNWRL